MSQRDLKVESIRFSVGEQRSTCPPTNVVLLIQSEKSLVSRFFACPP